VVSAAVIEGIVWFDTSVARILGKVLVFTTTVAWTAVLAAINVISNKLQK